MVIYNVTINLDSSIHKNWLEWINNHIRNVLSTGKFTKAVFTRILDERNIGEISYSIQYFAKSKLDLEEYIQKYSDFLKLDGENRFGNKMLVFRTKLELIKEYNLKST